MDTQSLSRKFAFLHQVRHVAKGYPKGSQNSVSRYTSRVLKVPAQQSLSKPNTKTTIAGGRSQAVVVNTLRALIVVIRTGHVTLALTLIHHEDDLRGHLCTEEGRLFEAHFLPLGEVLWWLHGLDVCRCLTVSRMCVLRHAHQWVNTLGREVLILSCSGCKQQRVDLRTTMGAKLRLRCVCACSSGSGNV
jgi:hypothetical protein